MTSLLGPGHGVPIAADSIRRNARVLEYCEADGKYRVKCLGCGRYLRATAQLLGVGPGRPTRALCCDAEAAP